MSRMQLRRDEQGVSMVEFALVLPFFALLLFAIVDFGALFSSYTTMRGGVQASARLASLDQYDSFGGTCGATDPTSEMVCTTISEVGRMLATDSATLEVGICFVDPGTTCAAEGNGQTGNQCNPGSSPATYCEVEICAQVTARSTTGITAPFLDGKAISTKSIVRLELGDSSVTAYHSLDSGSVTYDGVNYGAMTCT
jgi:Flp pilus assembly protein TadG